MLCASLKGLPQGCQNGGSRTEIYFSVCVRACARVCMFLLVLFLGDMYVCVFVIFSCVYLLSSLLQKLAA